MPLEALNASRLRDLRGNAPRIFEYGDAINPNPFQLLRTVAHARFIDSIEPALIGGGCRMELDARAEAECFTCSNGSLRFSS
jgi:hypothetical protein